MINKEQQPRVIINYFLYLIFQPLPKITALSSTVYKLKARIEPQKKRQSVANKKVCKRYQSFTKRIFLAQNNIKITYKIKLKYHHQKTAGLINCERDYLENPD